VILVSFDKYNGPTLTNIDGINVVPIVPILAVQTQTFGICPVEIPGQMGFSRDT